MLACRTLGVIIYFILFFYFSFDLYVGKIDICRLSLLPKGWVGGGGGGGGGVLPYTCYMLQCRVEFQAIFAP